jgi:hypothetical protein
VSGVESFGGDAAVAVLTRVVLLASFVSTVAGFAVVVAVVVVVAGSVAVYKLISGVASSVNSAAVVTALGGDVVRVVVLAFGAVVLDAIITALTAAMFAFKLDAFSRHFFLWARLPCPGPGMLL